MKANVSDHASCAKGHRTKQPRLERWLSYKLLEPAAAKCSYILSWLDGKGGPLQDFDGRVQQRMERTLRAITPTNMLDDSGALRSFPSFGG